MIMMVISVGGWMVDDNIILSLVTPKEEDGTKSVGVAVGMT